MAEDLRNDPLLSGVPEVDGYKVLDPAVLYAKVGEGGMGSVYRGRHLNLEIDVAVKVLDPDLARKDREFIARFRREANLAARITHPNLVRVFDVKEAFGLHYLVMEYVEGETALERVARKGPLGAVEALDIALEAAKGLGAAHAHGVVHRDVKPENLLIDRKGNVKVADLGLAHAAGGQGLTQTKVRMGTPRYMPPEQWEDARSVGPQGDVWALGATAYFLLAAEHAIKDGSLPEILKRVCLEPFPDIRKRRPEVPDALVEILERCTAKPQGERYADASALADALQEFRRKLQTPRLLPDERAGAGTTRLAAVSPPPMRTIARIKEGAAPGTPSPPPATRVRTPEPPRNNRLVPALAIVLLVAGVGGAYLLFREKGGAPGAEPPSRPPPQETAERPSAEDYEQALSLQAAVRTRRERLGEAPKEFAERASRARDGTERAILERLEALAREVLRGSALVDVDAAQRAGDAMILDKEYGKARAKLESAKEGLDALARKLETCEGQYRAEAAISRAEALHREVAAWHAANRLRAPKQVETAAEELRKARERVQALAFAEAVALAGEAERLLEDARTRGTGLVGQRAAAQQAADAARQARAAWEGFARKNAEDARASSGKDAIDKADEAFDGERFDEAKAGYESASDAFDEALKAAQAAAAAQDTLEGARKAWEKALQEADVALLGRYAAAAYTQAVERAKEAERLGALAKQGAATAAEATQAYREASAALASAVAEATAREKAAQADALIARIEAAIQRKDKAEADALLAEAEKLLPGESRIGGLRKRVDAIQPERLTVDLGGGVKMDLARIRPGEFVMGSPAGELERGADETQHKVKLTKAFYIGVTEVTQAQWKAVMGTDPSRFKGDALPVESVSWHDAVSFCEKLSKKAGAKCRLPTEAEWEYACRAGTRTPFSFGETISTDQANYDGDYTYGKGAKGVDRGRTTAVGSFPVNGWGLHDMHGNVWEWCSDWYDGGYYAKSPGEDPPGPASGSARVLRGGSWIDYPRFLRSALRVRYDPGSSGDLCGFRVVAVSGAPE